MCKPLCWTHKGEKDTVVALKRLKAKIRLEESDEAINNHETRQNGVHLEEKYKQIAKGEVVFIWSGRLKGNLNKRKSLYMGP